MNKFACDMVVDYPEWNSLYVFRYRHTADDVNFYDSEVLRAKNPRSQAVGHKVTGLSYTLDFLQELYENNHIALRRNAPIPKVELPNELFKI